MELIDRQAEFVEYRTFDTDVARLIKKLRLTATSNKITERLTANGETGSCHLSASPLVRIRQAVPRVLCFVRAPTLEAVMNFHRLVVAPSLKGMNEPRGRREQSAKTIAVGPAKHTPGNASPPSP